MPKERVIHLQTDWHYVACRKSEQRGELYASRSPADVTCPKCRRFAPWYWEKKES